MRLNYRQQKMITPLPMNGWITELYGLNGDNEENHAIVTYRYAGLCERQLETKDNRGNSITDSTKRQSLKTEDVLPGAILVDQGINRNWWKRKALKNEMRCGENQHWCLLHPSLRKMMCNPAQATCLADLNRQPDWLPELLACSDGSNNDSDIWQKWTTSMTTWSWPVNTCMFIFIKTCNGEQVRSCSYPNENNILPALLLVVTCW